MLSLPSKPWKKARIEALGNDCYRLTFLSEFDSESQFAEVIEEDVIPSLGEGDRVEETDWVSRSVVVATAGVDGFKRNLIFACVMIEIQ